METQMTFQRYEIKYLLDKGQKEKILKAMAPYMELDHYGRTSIRNIYYDTDDFRLIRRSLEKPVYKEKLRIRSYGIADSEDDVFVELKKKYKSIVYKRRVEMKEKDAFLYLARKYQPSRESQITNEIAYVLEFYQTLMPKVFLSYEREAYATKEPGHFRVTFDEHILWRENDLSLTQEVYGEPLLGQYTTLMEIKTPGGIPLWMVKALTETETRKVTFSKFGHAYLAKRTKERGVHG